MTIDWEPVRADVCRYYAEGKSLREVEQLIRETRHFHASIRAYRSKICEWNVKRPRQFVKSSLGPKRRTLKATPRRHGKVIISLISDDEGTPPPTERSKASSPAGPAGRQTSHGRQDLSHACTCTSKPLEMQMRRILAAFEAGWPNLSSDLGFSRSAFGDGVDNILQFATRLGTPSKFYAHMVDAIVLLKVSLDARDCNGMTALEIAVRKSDHEAVRTLRLAGASSAMCSIPKETLLHISVLHVPSSSVTSELLFDSFIVNAAVETHDDLRKQALRLISDILKTCTEPGRLFDTHKLLQLILMLGPVDRLSSTDIDSAFKALVSTWERSTKLLTAEIMRDKPLDCCKELLKNGADLFQPSDHCSPISTLRSLAQPSRNGDCTTLAHLVMFHQRDDDLALTVAQNCHEGSGERLTRMIMRPCTSRIAAIDVDRLSMLLLAVLTRRPSTHIDSLLFALEAAPDPLKYAFVLAILSRGLSKAQQRRFDADLLGITHRLISVAESVRWPLCELILARDPGFVFLRDDSAFPRLLFVIEPLANRNRAADYVDFLYNAILRRCKFTEMYSIWSAFCGIAIKAWDRGGETAYSKQGFELQRCVIHLITKMMLEPSPALGGELPTKTRVLWALQLRQRFHLPDVAVQSSLLIEALETEDRVVEEIPDL